MRTARLVVAAALAPCCAATLPAAATATVSTTLVDGAVSVTGDGASDGVRLTVQNGLIAVNEAATAAPATTATTILVDTGAGNDLVDAGALGATNYNHMSVGGGLGADFIIGGEGSDNVGGGPGDDALRGGPGGDTLGGGPGRNTMVGGEGSDGLISDNTAVDSIDGDAGTDTVIVMGSVADDPLTLAPTSSGARLRTLAGGSVEMRTEELDLFTQGGDDVVTVSAGVTDLKLLIRGGDGADTLTGSTERDDFFGDRGADTLTGGDGADLLSGLEEDDRIFARDGAADIVLGGDGTDSAQTDRLSLDTVAGVERLDAEAEPPPFPPVPAPSPSLPEPPDPPPVPSVVRDTTALLPKLGTVRVVRRHGRLVARVPLACPAAETGGCAARVRLSVRAGKRRAVVALGSAAVRLGPGGHRTASIRLARGFPRRRSLTVRLALTSSDASGNHAQRAARIGVRIPTRSSR